MAPPRKYHTEEERAAARREAQRRYAERHPARRAATFRAYVERNREECYRRSREGSTARRARLKAQVVALFGGRCQRCGFDDPRALQVDHIHGAEEPRGHPLRGGWRLYREIVERGRTTEDIQLLCANCNTIKAHENWERGGQGFSYKRPKAEGA